MQLYTSLAMCYGKVAINFSTLMGDGIQEGFGEEAACDLGLKKQEGDGQWLSGARCSGLGEQHGQRQGGRTAWAVRGE